MQSLRPTAWLKENSLWNPESPPGIDTTDEAEVVAWNAAPCGVVPISELPWKDTTWLTWLGDSLTRFTFLKLLDILHISHSHFVFDRGQPSTRTVCCQRTADGHVDPTNCLWHKGTYEQEQASFPDKFQSTATENPFLVPIQDFVADSFASGHGICLSFFLDDFFAQATRHIAPWAAGNLKPSPIPNAAIVGPGFHEASAGASFLFDLPRFTANRASRINAVKFVKPFIIALKKKGMRVIYHAVNGTPKFVTEKDYLIQLLNLDAKTILESGDADADRDKLDGDLAAGSDAGEVVTFVDINKLSRIGHWRYYLHNGMNDDVHFAQNSGYYHLAATIDLNLVLRNLDGSWPLLHTSEVRRRLACTTVDNGLILQPELWNFFANVLQFEC